MSKHLFLCTQARTGSSLLLHLLQLGPPETRFNTLDESIFNLEAFQYPQYDLLRTLLGNRLPHYCVAHQCDPDCNFDPRFFRQFIADYYQKYSNGNMITIKWFHWGLTQFLNTLKNQGIDVNQNTLPHYFGEIVYVYLYREDIPRQAISRYIARKTKQWWSTVAPEIEPTLENIPYDFDALYQTYQEFNDTHILWNNWFQEFGVEPVYRLSYETLINHYQDVLMTLSERLNVKIHLPAPEEIMLQKQTGLLNEQLYERFHHDLNTIVGSLAQPAYPHE